MNTLDTNIEIARIQKLIEERLSASNVIFDYSQADGQTKLNLITVNPRHNQSFLFHTERGTDKADALRKMLDYVENYKERENSYTVQWVLTGQNDLQTSYFRAKNIYEALDKLYFGREPNSLSVFSVVLNPIT
jgi:predicted ATP-grasp superfamily ATP-dependent carboligase